MLMGWQHLPPEDLRRIETGIVEGRVLGGPWHIELQPTNLCNVDCFFCISKSARHGESMPWPMLRRLLEDGRAGDLRMIRLTGGGEPLSYPHLSPLIDACGELGLLIENVNTNGVLLPRSAERLVRTGLDWILVSLNEVDPARYAKSMKASPAHHGRAVEGVRAIVAARDAAPPERRPRVWVQFFLWKESIPDIVKMYRMGRELGADTIFIRTIFGDFWGHRKMDPADLPAIKAQLREIIAEDCRSGENRLHFELSNELDLHHFTYAEQASHKPPFSENFPEFRRADPRTEYCYTGWYTTSISAVGKVFPCFQYHNMENKAVGDLRESGLDEIWRGDRYDEFRRQIRKLVMLRGRMEPSDKYNKYIEHKCAECDGCQYNHNLATPEFYERATRRLQSRFRAWDRAQARLQNMAIYGAHRVLQRPR